MKQRQKSGICQIKLDVNNEAETIYPLWKESSVVFYSHIQ